MVFWSISMFDQAVIFFYLTLAAVQAALPVASRRAQPAPVARRSTTHYVPRRELPTDAFGPPA
jgi:hypothetical protein